MGLDIYAGPVTRYVAGDCLTAVQQALQGRGMHVEVVRQGEPDGVVADLQTTLGVVEAWEAGLASSPAGSDAPVEDMAPLGLAVLKAPAEFADSNAVPWIMDY